MNNTVKSHERKINGEIILYLAVDNENHTWRLGKKESLLIFRGLSHYYNKDDVIEDLQQEIKQLKKEKMALYQVFKLTEKVHSIAMSSDLCRLLTNVNVLSDTTSE